MARTPSALAAFVPTRDDAARPARSRPPSWSVDALLGPREIAIVGGRWREGSRSVVADPFSMAVLAPPAASTPLSRSKPRHAESYVAASRVTPRSIRRSSPGSIACTGGPSRAPRSSFPKARHSVSSGSWRSRLFSRTAAARPTRGSGESRRGMDHVLDPFRSIAPVWEKHTEPWTIPDSRIAGLCPLRAKESPWPTKFATRSRTRIAAVRLVPRTAGAHCAAVLALGFNESPTASSMNRRAPERRRAAEDDPKGSRGAPADFCAACFSSTSPRPSDRPFLARRSLSELHLLAVPHHEDPNASLLATPVAGGSHQGTNLDLRSHDTLFPKAQFVARRRGRRSPPDRHGEAVDPAVRRSWGSTRSTSPRSTRPGASLSRSRERAHPKHHRLRISRSTTTKVVVPMVIPRFVLPKTRWRPIRRHFEVRPVLRGEHATDRAAPSPDKGPERSSDRVESVGPTPGRARCSGGMGAMTGGCADVADFMASAQGRFQTAASLPRRRERAGGGADMSSYQSDRRGVRQS